MKQVLVEAQRTDRQTTRQHNAFATCWQRRQKSDKQISWKHILHTRYR